MIFASIDNYYFPHPRPSSYIIMASMPVGQQVLTGDFPKELTTKVTKYNCGFMDHRSNGPLPGSAWVDKLAIYFLYICM